jgi:hypothetical protein
MPQLSSYERTDWRQGQFSPSAKKPMPGVWVSSDSAYYTGTTACTYSPGDIVTTFVRSHTTPLLPTLVPTVRHLRCAVHGNLMLEFSGGLSLDVRVERDGALYIASDNHFGIYGSGRSEDEALRDYESFFVEFYQDIVNSDEHELAKSTLRFKQTLQAFATLKQRG